MEGMAQSSVLRLFIHLIVRASASEYQIPDDRWCNITSCSEVNWESWVMTGKGTKCQFVELEPFPAGPEPPAGTSSESSQ